MNKSFNQFMKNAFLVSFGIVAVSALLLYSFMESKELTFRDIWNSDLLTVTFNGNNFMSDFDGISINLENDITHYDTTDLYEEDRFTPLPNIEINTSTEEIVFVQEARDDLKVVFDREVPDTPLYNLDYSTRTTDDKLIITSVLNAKNIYTDRDYKGTVTIYIPEDYSCESLMIKSAVADHNLHLPMSVEDLTISVSFGSIDINVLEPMENLDLSINAGDLHFESLTTINNIEASVDTGDLSFKLNEQTGKAVIENNVGAITGDLKRSPVMMDVNCNLGDVNLTFDEPVHTLTTSLNLGNLSINVSDDDHSIVYIDKDLVDYQSHLKSTDSQSEANIFVEMNLGDVEIH